MKPRPTRTMSGNLDEQVGTLHLLALLAEIIVLTQERAISIGVNVEGLVLRASRVPICFVATLVYLATAARGPLPLASAKKHHTLLAAAPARIATAERHH